MKNRLSSPAAAALGLLVASAFLLPSEARAYEEQVTLGLVADYAVLPLAPSGAGMHGVNGGLTSSYGLGDTFSLEGRLEHGFFPDRVAATHLSRASIGLTYAVDVLRLVPLLGLGLGGALGVRDGEAAGDLLVYGSFALDYLASRRWIVSGEARVEAFPLGTIDAVDRLAVTAGLRVALVFDTY